MSVEEVRFILCAPNLGAGFARPRPTDKGFTVVVGGGAAMAAQGSFGSTAAAAGLRFKGCLLEPLFGTGAAMAPHRSSCSSSFTAFTTALGFITLAPDAAVVQTKKSVQKNYSLLSLSLPS